MPSNWKLELILTLMSSCFPVGPLKFNISDYTGGLPTLMYEPNAWTKVQNLEELQFFISILA